MQKMYVCLAGRMGVFIKLMLVVVFMGMGGKGWGQVAGDYRSVTSGTWLGTATATWERYNGITWISSAAPLNNTINTVYISHTISSNGSFGNTINLVIENSGTFTVSAAGATASILVNNGGLLQINAALTNSGSFTIENGGRVNLNHSNTSGVSSLWNGTENFKAGSTFDIQNWHYNAAGNDDRLIQNPSIISANSTGGYFFGNLLISGNPTKIFVMSSLSQTIKLAENDFIGSTTAGSSNVTFTTETSNVTIGGNLIVTSNQFSFAATSSGTPVATINGNITPTSGTIDLNQINSGAATSIVQLKGNLNIPAGATLRSGDAGCKIVFSGVVDQTISIAGTLQTNVDFEIAGSSTAKLINQNLALPFAGNDFDVLALGILDFNGFDITGLGAFSQASTSSLKITSALGINPTGNNTGNIQNTGTRTFSQTGYFYFTGNSNPQSTGLAITTGSTAKKIFIEKTNPTDIVNLSQSTGITDQLTITTGTFVETVAASVYSTGGLTMSTNGKYIIPSLSTIVPQLSGPYNLSGSSTIELNGAGLQELRGARAYRNLVFSTLGTKTVSSAPSSIIGTITISNSAILDVANNSMGGTGTNLTITGTGKYITSGTSTKPDALGTYTLAPTSTIEFANSAGTQQDIRLAPNYGNIDVSGSNVGLSGPTSSLKIQAATIFQVTATGTFNVQNTNGFAGLTTTAIDNTTAPTISLIAGSTINYNGVTQAITNTVPYQNLKLSGTGLKTAPSANLLIEGNLTRSATSTFNANGGRVVFQGSTAQTFTDTTSLAPIEFYNLSNTNTSNLIVNNSFAVQNELNLTPTAKLNLNTGDIILRSTNTRTAYVTDLGTNAVSTNITYGTTGRFNIERYLPAVKSWRLLATPIEQEGLSITNSWREAGSLLSTGYGTQITGPSATSFNMDENTVRGSMKWYNKATNNYTEILNTADPIARPQGYYVFVRGDRAQNVAGAGSATKLRMRGKILTGDQTFTAPLSVGVNDGFESVGNPYPSQINYRTATKTNLETSFTVWNPSAGFYGVGRFIQYSRNITNGDYFNGATILNTIESGQAFFIQSAGGFSGSITIKESDKSTGSNTVSRTEMSGRTGVFEPTLEINLHNLGSSTASFLDQAVINFDNTFSNDFDGQDVRKFMNANDNLAIKLGNRNVIVERRKSLQNTDTVFLSLTNTRIASYRFEIDPSVLSNLPLNAYLKDKFLGTETFVSLSDVTNINFNITGDVESRATDRFMIVFRPGGAAGPLPVNFTTIKAEKNADKTNTVKWSVTNEINISNYNIERSATGVSFLVIGTEATTGNNGNSTTYNFVDAAPLAGINYYRIKAVSANGGVQYSAILKLMDNDVKPLLTIQPNPVINKKLNITFENMKGNYTAKLVTKQGGILLRKTITITGTNEVKNIVLDGAVAAGIYELVMVDSKGKRWVQAVYIN